MPPSSLCQAVLDLPITPRLPLPPFFFFFFFLEGARPWNPLRAFMSRAQQHCSGNGPSSSWNHHSVFFLSFLSPLQGWIYTWSFCTWGLWDADFIPGFMPGLWVEVSAPSVQYAAALCVWERVECVLGANGTAPRQWSHSCLSHVRLKSH